MGEIQIRKTNVYFETINVEFPYYIKDIYYGEENKDTTFGRIDESGQTLIEEKEEYSSVIGYEITKSGFENIYFEEKYKGTKEEFEKALTRAKAFINKI